MLMQVLILLEKLLTWADVCEITQRFMFVGATWDFCHYPILEAEALHLKEAIHSAIDIAYGECHF